MRTTAWRLALLCMALWGVVYYLRLFDQKLLLGDEGTILLDAWRIASGEIPHRDFFQGFPPASFIPTAALFLLFGPSLLAGRLLAFALAVSIVLSLDLVLRKLEADRVLRLLSLALLIPFGVSYWPIPSHHWWAAIHCLLSAYFLLSAPARGSPGTPISLQAFLRRWRLFPCRTREATSSFSPRSSTCRLWKVGNGRKRFGEASQASERSRFCSPRGFFRPRASETSSTTSWSSP